ncbi:DMT family transporter [Comamonas badia]|uniref:DMT family transporter n=1 Tax=Comamonas badia TaxID=265291 RepID=UPI0004678BE9|nr:DMT family transporter [Comamonas badia]
MQTRISPSTLLMLTAAPLMWAGNAVVGRTVHALVGPSMLNFLRWLFAFIVLLPVAWQVLRPGSALWPHWRRYSLLGLLGIGSYNALQYLALQTSTPVNVTLVAAGLPVWMLLVGVLFFRTPVARRQIVGALLSIAGVLLVLSRGSWQQLASLRLVPGDLYMVLATIAWAFYSWLLMRTSEPRALRADWSGFLMAQMVFGVGWSGAFAAAEWTLGGYRTIIWGWPLVGALVFIVIGPAVLAYRFWGEGVKQGGPVLAGFFLNLTPLFAAVMSAAFLGEMPHTYHGIAFLLIVGGIVATSWRR